VAVEGGAHKTRLACVDLTLPVDPNCGLHCEPPTYHKNEVGRRGGEEYEEVHSGAFMLQPPTSLESHAIAPEREIEWS